MCVFNSQSDIKKLEESCQQLAELAKNNIIDAVSAEIYIRFVVSGSKSGATKPNHGQNVYVFGGDILIQQPGSNVLKNVKNLAKDITF